MEKNFDLLVALKNNIVNNIESIRFDFGNSIPEGQKAYLQDFFAYNTQFEDSQEQFDIHIGYVGQLFNEFIY